MGRGTIPASHLVISLLIFGVLTHFEQKGALGKEFRREVTCFNDLLHLDCGKRAFIAIHEAFFSTDLQENQTCHIPVPEHEYIEDDVDSAVTESVNSSTCYEDIRISINRKCSGNKNCEYRYSQVPDRICSNPEGSFVVRFDCVRESNLNKYCSTKVQSREGYIMSPGYPQYYPKLTECSWALSALEGQSIYAKLLHVQLREAITPKPTPADPESYYPFGLQIMTDQVMRCDDDQLSVVEGTSNKHFDVCGENLAALRSVEADGNTGLEVRFRSSEFVPASGFLLYFKIQGCPTLPAKEGSYLVERNGSVAVYACEKHRVFNDTSENTRVLHCLKDRYWNDTLPPCTVLDEITTILNSASIMNTTEGGSVNNVTITRGFFDDLDLSALMDKNADLWADIIIPCLIVGILVIGNVFILIFIFVIRRRHKPNDDFYEMQDYQPEKTEG